MCRFPLKFPKKVDVRQIQNEADAAGEQNVDVDAVQIAVNGRRQRADALADGDGH